MRKLYSMVICLLLVFFGSSLAIAENDDAVASTMPAPILLLPQDDLKNTNNQANQDMASVAAKIEQLSVSLDAMHQDLQRLNQPQPRLHLKNVWLKNNILNAVNTWLLLISIVLSVILLKKFSKMKSQNSLLPAAQVTEPKIGADEYDFMSSAEGMTAKLDLVRAYIAMGEMTAAKETLTEVLRKGNTEQRQEAKSLLDNILQSI